MLQHRIPECQLLQPSLFSSSSSSFAPKLTNDAHVRDLQSESPFPQSPNLLNKPDPEFDGSLFIAQEFRNGQVFCGSEFVEVDGDEFGGLGSRDLQGSFGVGDRCHLCCITRMLRHSTTARRGGGRAKEGRPSLSRTFTALPPGILSHPKGSHPLL